MKRSGGDRVKSFTAFWWGDRGLSALLLVIVVLLFLEPFLTSPLLSIVTEIFFSLLLVSGVSVVSSRRAIRRAATVAAVSTLLLRWLQSIAPSDPLAVISMVFSLFCMGALTLMIMIQVFRTDQTVTSHRVRGAVAAYLLFGVTWTTLYQLLDLCLPAAFSLAGAGTAMAAKQDSFVYFSFVTLTTLGYGDITAVHPVARLCVIMEALFGQLYPATLLARLVSLEITGRQSPPLKDSS